MSERITENIVRKALEESAAAACAQVWEQSPDNERIAAALKKASKRGRGAGYPDFTVGFDGQSDFVLAIECKARLGDHEDKGGGPAASAVGGARHYAKALSARYNVLAIAVSGTRSDNLSVSHFWHLQGEDESAKANIPAELQTLPRYLELYRADGDLHRQGVQSLESLAKRMNQKLHNLKVTPAHRSLLVSAMLVALKDDKAFRDSYRSLDGKRLLKSIRDTHLQKMSEAGVDESSMAGIRASYGFMTPAGTGDLTVGTNLADMVTDIDESGTPVIQRLGYYDSIGRFYLEFLRYSNNDSELGIVLTPPHITDLAADLTGIGKGDVAYDNCAGTGGFLISAMKKMLADAGGDKRKEEEIKKTQILGTEQQASIVSLLHSNMFLHGDGRNSVRQGNCFEVAPGPQTGRKSPTVGLLNPPFKDKDMGGIEEMKFVLNNMSALKTGGHSRCAALLPMLWTRPARGEQLELKRQLLAKHTLEAVISLPDDLFYNSSANVVTCLMIFTAHSPHPENKKTWFAFCKDDGFEMRKHRGRVDREGKWDDIRKQWVSRFVNREVIPGFSAMRHVRAGDEWCAEAYLEADYGTLTRGDFNLVVRDFILARMRGLWPVDNEERALSSIRLVPLKDIFVIEKGHGLAYNAQTPSPNGINFIGRGVGINGVKGKVILNAKDGARHKPKPAGTITVAAGGSVLETFLQAEPFYTGVSNLCLTAREKMSDQAKLFYCALIRANKFRYNYGREANPTLPDILFPAPDCLPDWVKKTNLNPPKIPNQR